MIHPDLNNDESRWFDKLTPETQWTMRDAEDARRRLFDVAERYAWHVNETVPTDPDDDWISLREAVSSILGLEARIEALDGLMRFIPTVAHVVRAGHHRLAKVIDEETTDEEKVALVGFEEEAAALAEEKKPCPR